MGQEYGRHKRKMGRDHSKAKSRIFSIEHLFGNRQSYQTKGNDIHADIQVNFDAAAFGKKETIHLKDENGKVQALEVNIPAGIETGQSIRLSLFPEICRASSSADIWRRLRP